MYIMAMLRCNPVIHVALAIWLAMAPLWCCCTLNTAATSDAAPGACCTVEDWHPDLDVDLSDRAEDTTPAEGPVDEQGHSCPCPQRDGAFHTSAITPAHIVAPSHIPSMQVTWLPATVTLMDHLKPIASALPTVGVIHTTTLRGLRVLLLV